MITPQHVSNVYQKIGEFLVCFQWLEQRFRELGWFVNDPGRKHWPSAILRKETNEKLLEKVKQMYFATLSNTQLTNQTELKDKFSKLVEHAHYMRQYRNDLLHSAYIEVSSFDEVFELVKTNMKTVEGQESFVLTYSDLENKMREMGEIAFSLNIHYTQMIHCLPS